MASSVAFLFSVENGELTPDQSAHVTRIGKQFCMEMAEKYTRGQKEHGGNLFDMPIHDLLENAIQEAIDQVVYLLTIREGLQGAFEQVAHEARMEIIKNEMSDDLR